MGLDDDSVQQSLKDWEEFQSPDKSQLNKDKKELKGLRREIARLKRTMKKGPGTGDAVNENLQNLLRSKSSLLIRYGMTQLLEKNLEQVSEAIKGINPIEQYNKKQEAKYREFARNFGIDPVGMDLATLKSTVDKKAKEMQSVRDKLEVTSISAAEMNALRDLGVTLKDISKDENLSPDIQDQARDLIKLRKRVISGDASLEETAQLFDDTSALMKRLFENAPSTPTQLLLQLQLQLKT